MLLETGKRPLEMQALQRVHRYLIKLKLMPDHRLPYIAWNVGCKPQKTNKSKFLSSSLVQDIRKWFAKWNVEVYVDMQLEEGKTHEYELNFELQLLEALHNKWRSAAHKSKFEYYCMHIDTQYWERYRRDKAAQIHITTPMSHRARRAITMMRTRSHMLKIETGGWLNVDAAMRKCTQCNMEAIEHETHVTLECPAYAHIRADFPSLLQGCTTFEELLSRTDPSPVKLGIYFARILEHHETLEGKQKSTPTPT